MDLFDHAPVRAGDVLAKKYRVERVLGMGGMGIVVAARHLDLDQEVALKFLLPTAMDSEEMVSRFINEGRAVVRLKSEHVAKVLDVGRLDDGAPYIVMELLQGQDLAAVMKERQALAIEDAVSFVLQACEAVAEAHAAKIIHRDLKPQNMFLTLGLDGTPLVKVLDFGVSKSLTPTTGGDGSPMTLTRTQSMLGSPLYMSPEQMRSSKRVDERSDIWSFGVILFELFTGRVPFEAENVPELVFKIAEEEVPNPKELRPDLPDALCNAVLRCLQKDVDKRYSNLAELAVDIEPYASPRDKGLAARIGVMLGTQARPRMMSFSDVSQPAKSQPAIAVSDAWGATQAAGSVAASDKDKIQKGSGGRAISVGIGVVVLALLGVGGFAITSRTRNAADGRRENVGSAAPPESASPSPTSAVTGVPGSAVATMESHAASSSPSVTPSASVAARSGIAPVVSVRRPNPQAAGGVASAPVLPAQSATPSTSGRGAFIPVRE